MDSSGDKAIKTSLATCLGAGKLFMDCSGDKAIKTFLATFLGAGKVLMDNSGDKAIKLFLQHALVYAESLWIILEIRQ